MTGIAIHPSWVKTGGVALEIMEGKHDEQIATIQQACTARLKVRFRKGQRMRIKGVRNNIEIEGKECTVLKVNPKRISVGIGTPKTEFGTTYYPEGEFNIPPSMLVPLS